MSLLLFSIFACTVLGLGGILCLTGLGGGGRYKGPDWPQPARIKLAPNKIPINLLLMSYTMLETVIVEPKNKPTHTVIWLHGLGADGHDFEPIVPELQPKTGAGIRFILPHAPVRAVTLFGGMPARAWFDLFIQNGEYGFIASEVLGMAAQIQAIIDAQIAQEISPQNILLAGFSQGGAMAIYSALTSPTALGGVIGLSTFLPVVAELAANTSHRLPAFIAHGTADDVVPFPAGVNLANALKQAGFPVAWHSYPIGHGVSPEEVSDIKAWIEKTL